MEDNELDGMQDNEFEPMPIAMFDRIDWTNEDFLRDWAIPRLRRSVAIHNAMWEQVTDMRNLLYGDPKQPLPMGILEAGTGKSTSVLEPLRAERVGRCAHGVWMDTSCHHCKREVGPRDVSKLPLVEPEKTTQQKWAQAMQGVNEFGDYDDD